MSGYPRGKGDGLDKLIQDIAELRRRLRELEVPSGTQRASLVAQVQAKLAELTETVNDLVDDALANFYTQAETNSLVAAPGNISPGDVNASGALRAGSVYSTILSSDYRAVWVTGVDGQLGHVPSSIQFKQDVENALIDPAVVLALRLVTFRYIAAVSDRGEGAAVEVGLIAEEVHALGLDWLVDYDTDGNPFGVKFERLAFALLSVAQDHETRLRALEDR